MRFEKLLRSYIQYEKTTTKPISVRTIERRIKRYVKPFFSNSIMPPKPKKLLSFKEWLTDKPISQNYKREIYLELAKLINYGYRMFGLSPTTKRVKNFKKENKKQLAFYTNDQYARLRKKIKSKTYKTLLDILFYGGLRRGEAMALTPKDVQGTKLQITKTYTERHITDPKTYSSVRAEEMPQEIMLELTELAHVCKPNERLFKDTSYTTLKRQFDKAADKARLPRIRIHDLRHSHITNLLYAGFTPQGIAKRIGHSNTETLLNTYAETIDKEDRKIAKRMERDFTKAKRY